MKKYAQLKTLAEIFDMDEQWFERRKEDTSAAYHKIFFKNVHFFPQQASSRTKKLVLWDVEAVEKTIRGEMIAPATKNIVKGLLK